jgi:hypothetical protein
MRCVVPLSCALIAAIAGTAQGAFISFASDNNSDGPTFQGAGGAPGSNPMFRDGGPLSGGNVDVNLLIDADENGPGVATPVSTVFLSNITLTNNSQQALLGGGFVHGYRASGFYEFRLASTLATLLRVEFSNAYFASISNVATALGSSATLQANDQTSSINVITATGALSGLGQMRDFAFTLTAVQAPGGNNVPVRPDGSINLPEFQWTSEGSYSARVVVPTPASAALMAMAGLAAARRRR